MIHVISNSRSRRVCLAGVVMLVAVAGCGYRRPGLLPTGALVTLDGKPVAGASVTLVPSKPGRPAMGMSDDSGRVTFSTYGSRDGVPPGEYKAVVTKLVPTKKAKAKLEKLSPRPAAEGEEGAEPMTEMQDDDYENLLPARYAGIGTTDLSVTIDRATRRITLTLESEK